MIALDESALICDLAETYGIYDYRRLPVKQAAIFASGLRRNSRIRMRAASMQYSLESMLLASITDSLAFIAWSKTEGAKNGTGRPQQILKRMLKAETKKDDIVVFESGEEFEKERRRIIEGRK